MLVGMEVCDKVIFTLLHCLYGPCRTLASFRINFQTSVSLAIFLQPLTPIFFTSFSASSNHFFLGFPTDLFYSGIFFNTFFTVLLAFFPHVLKILCFFL